jgi:hypothetical protein
MRDFGDQRNDSSSPEVLRVQVDEVLYRKIDYPFREGCDDVGRVEDVIRGKEGFDRSRLLIAKRIIVKF